MKKTIAMLLTLVFILTCSFAFADAYHIGIIQMADNGAFTDMREGFIDRMRELDSNTVVFKKAALTRWADSHGVSASTLLDDLKGYPNASITNTLMDLGQGVKRYSSARQRCISIRLPDLDGQLPPVPDMADGEGEGECPF